MFFMLTGGYLRSLFSLGEAPFSCCDVRLELVRFNTLSARLPSVLLLRCPVCAGAGRLCWYDCCGALAYCPPVRFCSLTGLPLASTAPSPDMEPAMMYPELDLGCENEPCAVVLVG